MGTDMHTRSGMQWPVIIPSRYFSAVQDPTGGTRRFSLSAMADFAADAGFDGVDLSLDHVDVHDDGFAGVLYAFALRVADRGLSLPVCHLPFYMPALDDAVAQAAFVREQMSALRMASDLKIPLAVIHPIVRHGSTCTSAVWLAQNMAYLAPLRSMAASLDVTLAIENMTGKPYSDYPGETVFGSRPEDILTLADRLDTGICWDFGHAHLTGLRPSEGLSAIGRRLRAVHIHDNDGQNDSHLIPGRGNIDWQEAMTGLHAAGYGAPGAFLDLELKSSDLPADRALRDGHAAAARKAARRLCMMMANQA